MLHSETSYGREREVHSARGASVPGTFVLFRDRHEQGEFG